MSDVGQVTGVLRSQHLLPRRLRSRPQRQEPAGPRAQDRVEISWLADAMARVRALPEIREEKVAEVRAAIERGDYETPDKLEVVVDCLMQELGLL